MVTQGHSTANLVITAFIAEMCVKGFIIKCDHPVKGKRSEGKIENEVKFRAI